MAYEYDDEDDGSGRVLYGRVLIAVAVLALVFVLGRCSRSDSGEVEDLRLQVAQQQQNIETLNQQLTAEPTAAPTGASTETTPLPTSGTAGTSTSGASPGATTTGGAQSYTVQDGDTLSRIAERFYGDSTQFEVIRDANNLGSNDLTVGQVLTIPPEPG